MVLFVYACELPLAHDHKASPKRRPIRPLRITAPAGTLLTSAAHTVAAGTLHVVIHLLSAVASTLSDRFPEGDSGVSISWLDTDRRHSTHWREYLAHEAMSEEVLAFNYFLIHIESAPLYCRTLWTTGQSIETGLSLPENFLHYKNERGLACQTVWCCTHLSTWGSGFLDPICQCKQWRGPTLSCHGQP